MTVSVNEKAKEDAERIATAIEVYVSAREALTHLKNMRDSGRVSVNKEAIEMAEKSVSETREMMVLGVEIALKYRL